MVKMYKQRERNLHTITENYILIFLLSIFYVSKLIKEIELDINLINEKYFNNFVQIMCKIYQIDLQIYTGSFKNMCLYL